MLVPAYYPAVQLDTKAECHVVYSERVKFGSSGLIYVPYVADLNFVSVKIPFCPIRRTATVSAYNRPEQKKTTVIELRPRNLGEAGRHFGKLAKKVEWPVADRDTDYE